jgi:hypothetical protein
MTRDYISLSPDFIGGEGWGEGDVSENPELYRRPRRAPPPPAPRPPPPGGGGG